MRILFFVLFSTLLLTASGNNNNYTKKSIVKIYTSSKVPNYVLPWNSSSMSSTGSGAIIAGDRILTNAHVVANNTFIEVERYGERKKYIATVIAVSHQADLALLKVEDKEFFKGAKPIEFGELPEIEQKIVVYGYPMGGRTLSATIGVVSRIEHHRYAHSGESFLAIQVDAAVNPGNSGGPALTDNKIVGVVMQGIAKSQNIGYLVPITMVRHFLKDVEDGRYDGFADIGLTTQTLENPAIREYYKLDEGTTGKLVADMVYNSSVKDVIKRGDILISVDGHNIENDGTVEFRENEFTDFNYYLDQYQIGQSVKMEIIRDGKKLNILADLNHQANDILLVKTTQYDNMPSYSIFGGYVFSPLTRNLLLSTKANRTKLSYFSSQWPKKEKKEIVVLLRVLSSEITRGNNGFVMWPIHKINGEEFTDFKEFSHKLDSSTGKFIVLEDDDGVKVVINREEALAKEKDILKKYDVEYKKSADLR